jgi:hypothetical protein
MKHSSKHSFKGLLLGEIWPVVGEIMNRLIRLSILPALLLAFAAGALADSFTIESLPSTVSYVGYTAGSQTGSNSLTKPPAGGLEVYTSMPSGLLSTYALNPNGVWAPAISGSDWIGNNAKDGPSGGTTAPQGYYTYVSSFSATVGSYNISLDAQADDTAEIFLNGVLIVPFDSVGSDGKCAEGTTGPSCTTNPPFTVNPTGYTLNSTNVLTIIDDQDFGLDASGIDFSLDATQPIDVAPEPGSLLLLGTGLFALAFVALRKAKPEAYLMLR